MANARDKRFRAGLVLVTLATCAFFIARAAMALFAAEVLGEVEKPEASPPRSRTMVASSRTDRKRDPTIILKRNIFDSTRGDLTEAPLDTLPAISEGLPVEDVEVPCKDTMRLIGTVVLPGDLERSLAAIVGANQKAELHRGGAEVEGSIIRAIESHSVVLQNASGLCRLEMFKMQAGASTPSPRPATLARERSRRSPQSDRNAGLTDDEISQGIEKVNDSNYNISRAMLNKVLDNAGKLIGIAAVTPKMEGGQPVGMEIQGVQPGTLLTKLGIQNGDVLESVNGESLSSPDDALGAYTTLRTAEKLTLSIRRAGRSMMINYNLQ
jgi:general secretion pathway protein C